MFKLLSVALFNGSMEELVKRTRGLGLAWFEPLPPASAGDEGNGSYNHSLNIAEDAHGDNEGTPSDVENALGDDEDALDEDILTNVIAWN